MDFIREYFLDPILGNGWFNPVNTLVYGIILVMAVYLVFRLLKRMGIRMDGRFLYALLPFIFWGSSTRVLHDAAFAGVLTGPLGDFYNLPVFPTPGSYIITFSLALLALFVSLIVQRFSGFPYWKVMLAAGIALSAVNVILIPFANLFPLGIILAVTSLWFLLFHYLGLLSKRTGNKTLEGIFSKENVGLLSAHMLDATATWTAMTFFGYLEQHVVPNMVIPILGPGAMFLLKLVVMIPVLYLVDQYTEEGDFRNFLKIVILILGLAPGLRNTIRLAAMV